MAPRNVVNVALEGSSSTLPGLWKYPSHRNADGPLTGDKYLASRRADDGAEGLWRIHDKLYDLDDFSKRHPGGEHWIHRTKGTDITELFESHHLSGRPEQLLPEFSVRAARTPRNSPYTFREDGFYRTLKRRAVAVLARTPDTGSTRLYNDALVAASVALALTAAALESFAVAAIAGLAVTFAATCAHNFTHLKSNWRQYYLSLSLISLREWRVSHILSHHQYPNTLLDMEISMHEPILQFLPSPDKTPGQRLGSCLAFPLYAAAALAAQVAFRARHLRPEDLLPLVYLVIMAAVAGAAGTALLLWLCLCVSSSFSFHVIGLTAAHHHPDIFHDGDAPREDRDWGLGQLDAVRDRADHNGSRFLVLTMFGDHALHHLFPSVDHSRLPALYPALNETLREFGIEYRFTNTWVLMKGMFRQLARNKPNPNPPRAVIEVTE